VDASDTWGLTPLSRAGNEGNSEDVRLLSACGEVDPDTIDEREGRLPEF
jgi:hypothetical protein